MSDNNVIKLAQPGVFTDSLTEVLRSGARALLTQAVEAEVAEFLAKHADLKTETGHQRVVRHGHLPERDELQMCELDLAGARPAPLAQPHMRGAAKPRVNPAGSHRPRYRGCFRDAPAKASRRPDCRRE